MKFKIINKRVNVTDEEIESFKNFEGLMQKYHTMDKVTNHRRTAWQSALWITTGIAIALLTILYFYPAKNRENENKSLQSPKKEDLVSFPSKKKPDLTLGNQEAQLKTEVSDQKKPIPEEVTANDKSLAIEIKEPAKLELQESVEKNNSKIVEYEFVEAEPVGGLPSLYAYFESELKYPIASLADSIEGSVIIQFTISKTGKPEEIEIKKSLGTHFDQEAKRVILNMPEWLPATINGKPVNSKISVPLHFNIEND